MLIDQGATIIRAYFCECAVIAVCAESLHERKSLNENEHDTKLQKRSERKLKMYHKNLEIHVVLSVITDVCPGVQRKDMRFFTDS